MWAVMNSIPDVSEYYAIFDDYLDFDIHPWDKHGYDQGEMIPERKVALRYLSLAMNIHKADPSKLPTNFLSFMSEYARPEHKEPETAVKVTVNPKRDKKYSDLINESNREQEQQQQPNDVVVVTNKSQVGTHKGTGLSNQSMQGFNMAVRSGARTSDVIEKTDIRPNPKRPNAYIQTTTRSVFWDVPGEDSINPETWDPRLYSSQEDVKRIENSKAKRTKNK